jgi:hypothetical protein
MILFFKFFLKMSVSWDDTLICLALYPANTAEQIGLNPFIYHQPWNCYLSKQPTLIYLPNTIIANMSKCFA